MYGCVLTLADCPSLRNDILDSVNRAALRVAENRRAASEAKRSKEDVAKQQAALRIARRQAATEKAAQTRAEIYATNNIMRAWGQHQMSKFHHP